MLCGVFLGGGHDWCCRLFQKCFVLFSEVTSTVVVVFRSHFDGRGYDFERREEEEESAVRLLRSAI